MINNVADGALLDIREISLANLGSTALDGALSRLLSSSTGRDFSSFNSRI
jgi:hypothetical protein